MTGSSDSALFCGIDLREPGPRTEGASDAESESSSAGTESEDEQQSDNPVTVIEESVYTENENDVCRSSGQMAEEFADENKNIIWCLMKQVSLPTTHWHCTAVSTATTHWYCTAVSTTSTHWYYTSVSTSRKSTRLNSSHVRTSRMPSSACKKQHIICRSIRL